jgi:hypothetical protein
MQRIFSGKMAQIWLSPLVDDPQATYLTKLKTNPDCKSEKSETKKKLIS